MIKAILLISAIAHGVCGVTDCLLSYGKKGRLDLKAIKDPVKMREMFADVPLDQPLLSIIVGTFSITLFTFGYLALCSWMQGYDTVLSAVMFVSAIFFSVPIVTHHIICGSVEWFYIRLGRTDEVRESVLEFQKKTIITMFTGYLGLLVFTVCLFAAVVTGRTDLPKWACIFNTLPLMLLLAPTKLPAKGNIAGAVMFLGLALMI